MGNNVERSPEFKAFWGEGNHFIRKPGILSPFLLVMFLVAALTVYLCARLVFSEGEIEKLLGSRDSDIKTIEARIRELDLGNDS